MQGREPSLPWYRQRWPWLLIAGPLVAVIAGVITLGLAIRTNDSLVNDDYYKRGKEINVELGRDKEASKLGISAQILVSDNHQQARVLLSSQNAAPPKTVKLTFLHPTLANQDFSAELTRGNDGFYSGAVQLAPSTHWHVRLEGADNTWRIQGEWQTDEGNAIALTPRPTN